MCWSDCQLYGSCPPLVLCHCVVNVWGRMRNMCVFKFPQFDSRSFIGWWKWKFALDVPGFLECCAAPGTDLPCPWHAGNAVCDFTFRFLFNIFHRVCSCFPPISPPTRRVFRKSLTRKARCVLYESAFALLLYYVLDNLNLLSILVYFAISSGSGRG